MQTSNAIDWFEVIKAAAEVLLSSVAIVISVIAIVQTKKQIEQSNKQHLFDRRLEKYTIIEDLLQQFDCLNILEIDFSSRDELDTFIELILKSLFDCLILKDAQWTIDKLTESTDYDAKHIFILQCRNLSILSKETTIIFNNEKSNTISKFINHYEMFILTMYRYYTLTNSEQKKEYDWTKKIDEIYCRLKKLYKNIVDDNVMNLLLEETKL